MEDSLEQSPPSGRHRGEHCPPEFVEEEIERFLKLYDEIREPCYPVNEESARLHHRFVRTHPFQVDDYRASRLLMAYAYITRGLPPPVVLTENKAVRIQLLEDAYAGDQRRSSTCVDSLAEASLLGCLGYRAQSAPRQSGTPARQRWTIAGVSTYPAPKREKTFESDQSAEARRFFRLASRGLRVDRPTGFVFAEHRV